METPFLFNYAGKPWLTQYWTRQLIDSVYTGISPQKGYSGDEDQGLMGSLAVLLKIGLFSTNGGTAEKSFYEITSPVFKKVTIHLNQKYYPGKQFVIETKNKSSKNVYIQSANLNGSSLNKPWFWHEALVKGGQLILHMADQPNKSWGSGLQNAPPSMSSDK